MLGRAIEKIMVFHDLVLEKRKEKYYIVDRGFFIVANR
jgi:hypothetical protein